MSGLCVLLESRNNCEGKMAKKCSHVVGNVCSFMKSAMDGKPAPCDGYYTACVGYNEDEDDVGKETEFKVIDPRGPLGARTVYDLTDHEVMREAVGYAYAIGVVDYENGRIAARTGRVILELIKEAAGWKGQKVIGKDAHLRYLKSAYQAAKFNCSMQRLILEVQKADQCGR
jgi:hypothetical protein